MWYYISKVRIPRLERSVCFGEMLGWIVSSGWTQRESSGPSPPQICSLMEDTERSSPPFTSWDHREASCRVDLWEGEEKRLSTLT